MSSSPSNQLFRPYLPLWLQKRVDRAQIRPGSVENLTAAILYADLSGFTRLAAAFATFPDGAERLHDALGYCYETLVTTIVGHEGDVVAIAGDALTAWWPNQSEPAVAVRCATALIAAIGALPPINTPNGPFQIELRIGISAGTVHTVLAGQPSHGIHLVVFGPAITAATYAERQAEPGTIHLSAAREHAPLPIQAAPETAPLMHYEDVLAPAFVERLRLNTLVPEYRRCVPVFCAFNLPTNPGDLHRLAAQVQSVVGRWGGWLNEIEIGDKGAVFVLLFGAPLARGDDTSRAVGCALELRERSLIRCAAITVGVLFVGPVGSSHRQVYTAQGDDMNLAAHLMEQAANGEILVSGRVRNDVLGRYRTNPPQVIVTKGHSEGVPVARVLATSSGENPSLQRFLPGATDLIGRTSVREHALAVASEAALGRTQLLLVEGESGIGKSVLLQHLMAQWNAMGRRGLAGECSGGGQESPLQPWQPILRDLCLIDESANPGEQRRQLETFLYNAGIEQIDREALADALDLGDSRERDLKAAIAAIITLLRAMLHNGPLLIVLEDAHWADHSSLALVEAILEAYPAIGALCLALSFRPLDAATPATLRALTAHPLGQHVALGPLHDADAHHLIRMLLGVEHLDAELARHIERHTEGQPLFIREYLRILRQQGMIRIEDDMATLVHIPGAVQLSNSAQGVIQARIDRLDEPTRLTLKVAAVIGRSFPLRLLAAIHPAQPEPHHLKAQLDQAALRPMIDLELDDPERVYRFSYGIAHEVAYTSLLFGQRREIHSLVAQWYANEYAAELASGTALLAVYDLLIEHLRRSEHWHAAAEYCRKASIRAIDGAAYNAALHYLDQAIMLAADRTSRCEALLVRVALKEYIGNYRNQAEDVDELLRLTQHQPMDIVRSAALIFRLRLLPESVASNEARRDADVLQRQLRRSAQDGAQYLILRAACLAVAAEVEERCNNLVPAQRIWRHCLKIARNAVEVASLPPGMSRAAIMARAQVGIATAALAQQACNRARRYYHQALTTAHSIGDWCGENRARLGLADLAIAEQRYQDARNVANRVLGDSQVIGDRRNHAAALRRLAAIRAAQDDPGDAQRMTWHALAISTLAHDRAAEVAALHDLAHFAEMQGQIDEATALRREAGL